MGAESRILPSPSAFLISRTSRPLSRASWYRTRSRTSTAAGSSIWGTSRCSSRASSRRAREKRLPRALREHRLDRARRLPPVTGSSGDLLLDTSPSYLEPMTFLMIASMSRWAVCGSSVQDLIRNERFALLDVGAARSAPDSAPLLEETVKRLGEIAFVRVLRGVLSQALAMLGLVSFLDCSLGTSNPGPFPLATRCGVPSDRTLSRKCPTISRSRAGPARESSQLRGGTDRRGRRRSSGRCLRFSPDRAAQRDR